jgi:phospholipase/carboxylesterase
MSYLSQLVKDNGLETDALAIVGFSQGTMMALQVAPQFSTAIAGVVGFSGAMADAEGLKERMKSRPPVLLVHGEADDVVPFSAMTQAEKALSELDFVVESYARPRLGHGIDEVGLRAAANFLKTVLPE